MSFLNGNDELLEGSDDPVGSDGPGGDPVLRFAQNKKIVEAELAKLQSLVDDLVEGIHIQQPNVWAVTSSIYGIRSYAKLGFFGGRHGTS